MIRERILAWLGTVPLRSRILTYVGELGARAWLVGGTVRDALLDRPSMDLDLAVEGDALALAQRTADRFGGAFVPLDADRDVGRVVLMVGDQHLHVDFAALRAENILADLCARDYTVNAMGVSLDERLELLDPTGGQADLKARLLRMARSDAFANDPLRVLRGVRLRGSLGFDVAPETEALMRAHAAALANVSVERVRDELTQILALERAAESLGYAAGLGILGVILPEFSADAALLAAGVRAVAALEELCAPLWADPLAAQAPAGSSGEALVDYAPGLTDSWGQELTVGRTRWQMAKLAALLSALPGSPALAEPAARRLHLSRAETRFGRGMLRAREGLLTLGRHSDLEPLEVYRYFREVGESALAGIALSLALSGAPGCPEVSLDRPTLCACAHLLLEAWFERHATLVEPPPLLSGYDLVLNLQLKPGPILGELTELLREVQVQGLVVTRHEALAYLRAYLLGQR